MDSTLEEEIARLSRPQTADNKESTCGTNLVGTAVELDLIGVRQPLNTASTGLAFSNSGSPILPSGDSLVFSGQSTAVPMKTHRRSGSGDLPRQGKPSTASRASPPPRAAAVLAGQAISDLQASSVPLPAGGSQQQRQVRSTVNRTNSSNGGNSGRPALNGEKVAGAKANIPVGRTAAAMVSASAAAAAISQGRISDTGAGVSRQPTSAGMTKGTDEDTWRRSEEALKKKEQSVRQALKDKQRSLQQESKLLATVNRELAQLAIDHQAEINDLRKTLESVDRELAFLDKDAQRKLDSFEKARTLLSAKVTEKKGITSRLTELIMASERQRDAKLNEIMRKMSPDTNIDNGSGAKRDSIRSDAGTASALGGMARR